MRLLFVNEVARLLGVSEAWLRRVERHGRIPKVGRDTNGRRVYSENRITRSAKGLLPERLPEALQAT